MDELSVDVGNGRSLGYREYGASDGHPVVSCHGGLLCGLDVAPYADAAEALGVRLISPDRPGLVASGAAPGRTTADWATQYALACAALLETRVTRVVIAGALPLDNDETFGELNAMDRRLTRLSQHHPHVASTTFKALGEIARHAPAAWAHLTARGAVPDEASAIESLPDPGIAEAGARAMEHGEGMVEEYLAWARPWGFTPEDVRGPVTIWQGDADELVPPKWGDELARRIPNAQLEARAGEGHFLGYLHQTDILRTFTKETS